MIFKILAIGGVSYAGLRYIMSRNRASDGAQDIRLAGGPLSSAATLQHSADPPRG